VRHLRPDERTVASMLQRALGGVSPEKTAAAAKQSHRKMPNLVKDVEVSSRCLAGWCVRSHTFTQEAAVVIRELTAYHSSLIESCEDDYVRNECPVCVLYLMEDGQPLDQLLTARKYKDSSTSHINTVDSTVVEKDSLQQCFTQRTNFLIVLGDDRGLSSEHEKGLHTLLFGENEECTGNLKFCEGVVDGSTAIPEVSFFRVRIGKRPLLASQCVLLALHIIEETLL